MLFIGYFVVAINYHFNLFDFTVQSLCYWRSKSMQLEGKINVIVTALKTRRNIHPITEE